jgi:hypothetical protein
VLRFPHQQGCKEKQVPLAQVRRLPFCLFSLVDVDGITIKIVRLLLSGQNFKGSPCSCEIYDLRFIILKII